MVSGKLIIYCLIPNLVLVGRCTLLTWINMPLQPLEDGRSSVMNKIKEIVEQNTVSEFFTSYFWWQLLKLQKIKLQRIKTFYTKIKRAKK